MEFALPETLKLSDSLYICKDQFENFGKYMKAFDCDYDYNYGYAMICTIGGDWEALFLLYMRK